jgi:hypothetical protein
VTGGRPRSSSGRVGPPSLPAAAGAPLFPQFLEVGQTAPNQVDFPPQGDLTIPRTQNPTTQTPEGKVGGLRMRLSVADWRTPCLKGSDPKSLTRTPY